MGLRMIATQIEKGIRKRFYGMFWDWKNQLATDIWQSKLVQCIEGGVQVEDSYCLMPDRYLVSIPESPEISGMKTDQIVKKLNKFVHNYAKESDYKLNNEVRIDVIKGAGRQDNGLDICGWVSAHRPNPSRIIAATYRTNGEGCLRFKDIAMCRNYFIGRSLDAQIQLDDPYISLLHSCLIIKKPGQVVVKDLQSRNGIYVRGVRLEPNKYYDFGLPITLVVGGVFEIVLKYKQ